MKTMIDFIRGSAPRPGKGCSPFAYPGVRGIRKDSVPSTLTKGSAPLQTPKSVTYVGEHCYPCLRIKCYPCFRLHEYFIRAPDEHATFAKRGEAQGGRWRCAEGHIIRHVYVKRFIKAYSKYSLVHPKLALS